MLSIGQKVKVRSDLVIGEYYGDRQFKLSMVNKCGCEVIIERANQYRDSFILKGDTYALVWSEKMFEPIVNKCEQCTYITCLGCEHFYVPMISEGFGCKLKDIGEKCYCDCCINQTEHKDNFKRKGE